MVQENCLEKLVYLCIVFMGKYSAPLHAACYKLSYQVALVQWCLYITKDICIMCILKEDILNCMFMYGIVCVQMYVLCVCVHACVRAWMYHTTYM